jgi:hypothetical protein
MRWCLKLISSKVALRKNFKKQMARFVREMWLINSLKKAEVIGLHAN